MHAWPVAHGSQLKYLRQWPVAAGNRCVHPPWQPVVALYAYPVGQVHVRPLAPPAGEPAWPVAFLSVHVAWAIPATHTARSFRGSATLVARHGLMSARRMHHASHAVVQQCLGQQGVAAGDFSASAAYPDATADVLQCCRLPLRVGANKPWCFGLAKPPRRSATASQVGPPSRRAQLTNID